MYSNKLYAPLRYPGGKARFASFLRAIVEQNDLQGGHYFEPYAGGAAVALELLFDGSVSHIHINDLDQAVYDFWCAVIHFPEELLRLLHDTPVNMDQWHYWRDVLRGKIAVDQVERGFATLFMNRTNRSGVLKAGVIGGMAQNGHYKLDARFKKDALNLRIERIAQRCDDISVYNDDACLLLLKCKTFLPPRSLIYLDPPYYVKGQGLYRNFYEHNDHLAIAQLLQKRRFGRPWVVSYDNVEEIREMYKKSEAVSYDINYTAGTRYMGSEVMFFSNELNIPEEGPPQSKLAA